MSGALAPPPTQAGFTTFVFQIMGVPTTALPSDSPVLTYAYQASLNLVWLRINAVSPFSYMAAVYNLAGHFLVKWAPDGTGSDPNSTVFATMRKNLGLLSFTAGVVTAAADVSTSDSLTVPDFFKNLTLADLDLLKTPWGRDYLSIVQDMGTLWGIS